MYIHLNYCNIRQEDDKHFFCHSNPFTITPNEIFSRQPLETLYLPYDLTNYAGIFQTFLRDFQSIAIRFSRYTQYIGKLNSIVAPLIFFVRIRYVCVFI